MSFNVAYDDAHEKVLFDPGETSNCQFSSMQIRDVPKKKSYDVFWTVAMSVLVNCLIIGIFSYFLFKMKVVNMASNEIGLQNCTKELAEMKQSRQLNLSTYLQLEKDVNKLKFDQKVARKELDNLTSLGKHLIPIGFIYVQLPNEKAPVEIWPTLTWTDVSSTYAGVFFRVEGGDAAPFGDVQSDNAPRLTGVKYGGNDVNSGSFGEIETKLGDWSNWIYTGGGRSFRYHSFKMSSGEVRPVNMAMRIWKRTG